jgi:hypothetical protein
MTKGQGSFSGPPEVVTFDGVLSDFDGTIVDSTDGKDYTQFYNYVRNHNVIK